MNSRYYNLEWGRFINADEIAAVTGDLLSANMFAYCKNSPISYFDPSGFKQIKISDNEGSEFSDWRDNDQYEEEYERNYDERGRSSYAKKREKSQINSAWGKDRAKRKQQSRELHKTKAKGRKNYDNDSYSDLKNGNYKSSLGVIARVGLVVVGTVTIVGTIVEDIATGGVGIADDSITLSAGGGMIIKAFVQ